MKAGVDSAHHVRTLLSSCGASWLLAKRHWDNLHMSQWALLNTPGIRRLSELGYSFIYYTVLLGLSGS
jgi:hypothetical protein